MTQVMYPVFYLGILGASCRVVGGNPGHTVFEIRQMLSTCKVRLIITEPQLLDKVQKAAEECEIHPSIYTYGESIDGSSHKLTNWRSLLQHGERDWLALTKAEAEKEIAAYFVTSGTTASPKYAAVSHAYFTQAGSNIEVDVLRKPYPISRLVSLPLMHAFVAPLVIVGALRCGTPTYLMARFSTKVFLESLSGYGITEIPAVPSMLSALLSDADFDAGHLGSLREIMSAGAPLNQSLALKFESLLPRQTRLIQLYGLTEAGWTASVPYEGELCTWSSDRRLSQLPAIEQLEHVSDCSLLSNDGNSTPGTTMTSSDFLSTPKPSIGHALPGYRLELFDTETNSIISAPMMLGEILIEAPHPFLYYLDAPEATAATFMDMYDLVSGGWRLRTFIKSGDIAYFDAQGNFFIVDRLKDLIKVRGWQVSPAELESVLLYHPGVADAAVIGLQDADGISGELPHAFVVRTKPQPISVGTTEEDLKRWVRDRLAAYKALASVRFVDSVPRNPAGKILKRLLRESC
ncbi:MAG: hypothetical protein LQ340_001975 [Diploschistes diacapsis]|nr:MAG: hypothetical protein LQ340_001975 [Diploschistes diacapsis]